jgi:hypothetical protein
LALKPIDAETVMAALEDMGKALDQLEVSSSMINVVLHRANFIK